MASQIHVFNRNGTYYFRRRVPKDLLSLYPSSQIIFSLKTKDRREADRLARIESVKVDQEFQRQRSDLLARSAGGISDEDIRYICDLWIAYALEEDEERRFDGLSDRDYRKLTETLNIVDAGERHDFAKGDTTLIEFEMEDFCESHGFNVVKGTPTYRKLAYAFLRANVEATQKMLARHRGEIVDTPKAPSRGNKRDGLTLSQVLFKWKLEAKPKPKTLTEWELSITRFHALHGELNINQITKAHMVAFKDNRLMSGNAPATVTKQLGALSSLLQYSVDNDLLTTNIAAGVRVARGKVEKKTRLPYEIDDLNKIFTCPIYISAHRPQGGAGEADQVYLQAKRYAEGNNIGAGTIRDFYGALSLKRAHKGIFVTTSAFSQSAVQTARDLHSRIVLIDGVQLAQLMIRYDIGCRREEVLYLKKIDEDFFE